MQRSSLHSAPLKALTGIAPIVVFLEWRLTIEIPAFG